jgi:hypothetical protein
LLHCDRVLSLGLFNIFRFFLIKIKILGLFVLIWLGKPKFDSLERFSAMTEILEVKQAVVDILEDLPPEEQKVLLQFAESLQAKNLVKKPLKNLKGIWSNLNLNFTEEELAKERQEIWNNFPRDINL